MPTYHVLTTINLNVLVHVEATDEAEARQFAADDIGAANLTPEDEQNCLWFTNGHIVDGTVELTDIIAAIRQPS